MSTSSSGPYSPDERGYYGPYGGRFAPETLIPALEELEAAFNSAKADPGFLSELAELYQNFVGRPTPLFECKNISRTLGGGRLFIKNEGLAHTGAHKINHCVGQALLAKRMGKRRIIAETGAGQHGLATAAVSAMFGLECVVYMGAVDAARQRPNVFWMETLGARVVPVEHGGKRLKDAVNAAMKDWLASVESSHYLLGSVLGPHPFPEINRFFQSVVGREIREQLHSRVGKLPDFVIACVGGGSNAIGAFDAFLSEPSVSLIGVEAGGKGPQVGENASRIGRGRMGVVEGYKSLWLLDDFGQVANTHSISAGLDYPGIGPLHAWLHEQGRVAYASQSDEAALAAVKQLASAEGIIPALESAHALAHALELLPKVSPDTTVVVNISGRGDKDLFILGAHLGESGGPDNRFLDFLQTYVATHRK